MNINWNQSKKSLSKVVIISTITFLIGLAFSPSLEYLEYKVFPYLGFRNKNQSEWYGLSRLQRELQDTYDGDIDYTNLVQGAKKGLVESLGDPYTVYMTREESEAFDKSLQGDVGAGVGIEMGKRDGYIKVLRTLPDNPARKAGILSGDIIYKINGEDAYQLETDQIAQKVRGPVGSQVSLTIVRNGEEKTFNLIREKINNVSADIRYQGDTAILMVTRFDQEVASRVKTLSAEFKQRQIKKIILDLRGNSGGYLNSARDLLSFWIDGKKILTQKSKHFADIHTYANRGQVIFDQYQTVVLINHSSASASEIVAGALKDYQKATLIGETTFGKGVVQTLKNLPGGNKLKVTTARWYTPNGHSINKTGIKPDKEIINTFDDINQGKDPQLDAALNL